MQRARHFEAGEARHLHVQEHDVRLEILEQAERCDAVGGLADDRRHGL